MIHTFMCRVRIPRVYMIHMYMCDTPLKSCVNVWRLDLCVTISRSYVYTCHDSFTIVTWPLTIVCDKALPLQLCITIRWKCSALRIVRRICGNVGFVCGNTLCSHRDMRATALPSPLGTTVWPKCRALLRKYRDILRKCRALLRRLKAFSV